MISRRPPTHVLCFGGRGAGLRNEDKHRRGTLPIAQLMKTLYDNAPNESLQRTE